MLLAAWEHANVLHIDQFPWYAAGQKQDTQVRLLYDDEAVYVQFICEDSHIFAEVTEFQGPVCLDSCVEFFAMFDPRNKPDYFNLETNCCGMMHLGLGEERNGRRWPRPSRRGGSSSSRPFPARPRMNPRTTTAGGSPPRCPSTCSASLPARRSSPQAARLSRANFYRCGGKTDCQYGSWNFIPWKQPDFHRPEFFGDLFFA